MMDKMLAKVYRNIGRKKILVDAQTKALTERRVRAQKKEISGPRWISKWDWLDFGLSLNIRRAIPPTGYYTVISGQILFFEFNLYLFSRVDKQWMDKYAKPKTQRDVRELPTTNR